MDDPLSALDAHVGKVVMKECFVKLMKGKTRVMVTHALQYLKYCDTVIYLKEGEVCWHGSYEELVKAEFYTELVGTDVEMTKLVSEIENYEKKEHKSIQSVFKKERKQNY